MKLKDGEPLRPFDTVDLEGNTIRLDERTEQLVLLSFYRYASCPLCNLRVSELRREQARLEQAEITPIAVFQSSPANLREYVGQQAPWFPLIPDPNKRLYRLYDVTPSWLGFAGSLRTRLASAARAVFGNGFIPGRIDGDIHMLPADFLIGRGGRIIHAYYGRDIGDHLPLEDVFQGVDTARETRGGYIG